MTPDPPAPQSGPTTNDAFDLVPTGSGRVGIRSRTYQEVCHPGVGPAEEADALYVRGLDLPRRMAAMDPKVDFVVWDVGLGGAANALAVIHAARAVGARLRLLSFDFSLAPLTFAHAHRDALGYFRDLAPLAAELVAQGRVELKEPRWSLHWEFVGTDFARMLTSPTATIPAGNLPPPHAILFDPHSPRSNPEMWTLSVFTALYRCTDPAYPCNLATYSRSTAVRVALLMAGWHVGRGGATGSKEETTLAATHPALVNAPLDADWLQRARRSGAAEPWNAPPHQAKPLCETSWRTLCQHPQFTRADAVSRDSKSHGQST